MLYLEKTTLLSGRIVMGLFRKTVTKTIGITRECVELLLLIICMGVNFNSTSQLLLFKFSFS
ncbi:hypothetical protein Hdeb2414_s0050g00750901 [Helianthus debilis subsp. tardiflorus]